MEKNKNMEMQNEIPNYSKEDVIEMPELLKCVVQDLRITTGGKIFVNKEGEVKTDKPDEEFIVFRVINEEKGFNKECHLKKYAPGRVPDNSALGKFILRYGSLESGKEVRMLRNVKGYYDLVL